MFNFTNENLQLSLYGASLFGLGALLYSFQKFKKQLQTEIQLTKKAKVFEIDDLQRLLKDVKSQILSQKDSTFFLIKLKPLYINLRENTSLLNKILHTEIDVYSNQLYYCPPSLDKIFEKSLKDYHKQADRLDKVLLTDKFQSKVSFKPRQKYLISQDKNTTITNRIRDVFYLVKQILYSFRQFFWYYAQKPFQLFPRYKRQKRSYDKNRSTFFKGVWAGVLSVNFNLLKDSYFLLKVRVQESQIYTQFIADNKLMLINNQKMRINYLNRISVLLMALCLFDGYCIGKVLHRHLKKIWFRMTTFDRKILNLSNLSDDKLCQICYLNCRNILFYRCRHFIVCDDCYQHLDKQNCIICNLPLQKAQPLYIKQN